MNKDDPSRAPSSSLQSKLWIGCTPTPRFGWHGPFPPSCFLHRIIQLLRMHCLQFMGASLYPRGLRAKLTLAASRVQSKPLNHEEMQAVTWKLSISADLCRASYTQVRTMDAFPSQP